MDNDVFDDTFTMVLSSEHSHEFHPENTPSRFSVQFDKHIILKRPMEVAVSEVIHSNDIDEGIYLSNWKMILTASKSQLSITDPSGFVVKEVVLFELDMEPHKYKNRTELFKQIENLAETYRFKADPADVLPLLNIDYKLHELNTVDPIFAIKDSKLVQYTGESWDIGLPEDKDTFCTYAWKFTPDIFKAVEAKVKERHPTNDEAVIQKEVKVAPITYDFIGNITLTHMFIQSNIVKPSIVGPKKRSILRIIPFKKVASLKSTSHNFSKLHFYPLNKNELTEITVTVTDFLNNLIVFKNGLFVVTLIFRPIEHI